jgi:hypothetical protein
MGGRLLAFSAFFFFVNNCMFGWQIFNAASTSHEKARHMIGILKGQIKFVLIPLGSNQSISHIIKIMRLHLVKI